MKFAFVTLAAVAKAAMSASVDSSPVGKAIELLSDLQQKIIKEGEASQKLYSENSEFCEDRSMELAHDIKTGKATVAELNAVIGEAEGNQGSLSAKIEQLASDISTDESDLKAAKEVRAKEGASFATSEKELVEIIGTLERAVAVLERESKKGAGATLLQLKGAQNLAQALDTLVQASMLSTADAGRLSALVQTNSDTDDDEFGAPAAAVYKFQSGNIVEVLSDLLDKAQDQLESLRKQETSDLQAFELMQQSLEDEIKFANKEFADAKSSLAAAGERKSQAEGDLGMAAKALNEDEKDLGDLHHSCMTKAQDFEAETKSRTEELKALADAKETLQENTGAAADLSYSFIQVSQRSSASITSRSGLVQFEVLRFVQDLARKDKTTALAQLASRVGNVMHSAALSGSDPFGKVKNLIMDLVAKLEKEQDADATHKGFCDKELAETNAKKTVKTDDVEKLTTSIDKMSAQSAQLKEQVAALQKALADLATAQAQMDKIRVEEKALFATNKADLSQGLEGVKLALKILGEYYAKDTTAHGAAEGAGSTVIGLLEVVESDFTKNLAEITAVEDSASSAYDTETKENDIERTMKEQDVKYKDKEAANLDQSIAETSSDRASTQEQLDAVIQYLKQIEAQCIAKAETYEERHARFVSEISGLKEALKILSSETALLQRHSLRKQLRGGVISASA